MPATRGQRHGPALPCPRRISNCTGSKPRFESYLAPRIRLDFSAARSKNSTWAASAFLTPGRKTGRSICAGLFDTVFATTTPRLRKSPFRQRRVRFRPCAPIRCAADATVSEVTDGIAALFWPARPSAPPILSRAKASVKPWKARETAAQVLHKALRAAQQQRSACWNTPNCWKNAFHNTYEGYAKAQHWLFRRANKRSSSSCRPPVRSLLRQEIGRMIHGRDHPVDTVLNIL